MNGIITPGKSCLNRCLLLLDHTSNRFCGYRSHRVLLLKTICVSPVVFLVFAAWETPGSGAQRRRTGEGLPCCEGLKKTRGESMLEEGAPCVTGCQWTTDGSTEYLRQNREKSRFFPASTRQWPKLPHFLNHFRNNPNELVSLAG